MKIGGVDPSTLPKEEILILPRGETELVLRATGISDYDAFNALCPEPKPPGRLTKDGWEPNEDDEDYKSLVEGYNSRRLAWLVVMSLDPSDIEWDTVDVSKPSTWKNWDVDMRKAGLNQVECNRILQLVFQANCLDEAKLKEARENFLLGQRLEQKTSSGPSTEPGNTQSGKPASE